MYASHCNADEQEENGEDENDDEEMKTWMYVHHDEENDMIFTYELVVTR